MVVVAPTIKTNREAMPWTIAGTVGLPGGAGVDVGYQVHDRVQISAHAATWVAVTDVGADIRFFPVAGESGGMYVSGGVRGLIAPVLLNGMAPAFNTEVGGEYRSKSGFTFAGGVGGMVTRYPEGSEGGGGEWGFVPSINVRIGKSF